MSKKKNLIPNREKEKVLQYKETHFYQGPIPTPEMLNHYNKIQHDFAHRIMLMAEKEQERTISIEKSNMRFGFLITIVGLIFGFCTMAGLIYALVYAIKQGNTGAATAISASMATVGGLFIYRKTRRN